MAQVTYARGTKGKENDVAVYGLYDPTQRKTKLMYYGNTSQRPTKRLHDHISEVRHHIRAGMLLSPKMEWVYDLLEDGKEPWMRVLKYFGTKAEAEAYEEDLIRAHKDKILNQHSISRGRPVGIRNTPEAIRNQCRAQRKRQKLIKKLPPDADYDQHSKIAYLRRVYMGVPNPVASTTDLNENLRYFKAIRHTPKFILYNDFKRLYMSGRIKM